MDIEQGKIFIGGISWDTDEDGLKEYFGAYGEVIEAVIMRDRTTGRARGFGFIVFANPAVAERVVKEKHMIDGRTVEAKKAVPRDDQHLINRNSGSIQGSPGPGRTRKIFVGGLASTVTENDFKSYFEQFGTITDVVVMYDHNTQRPRGFGFITYDSEDAVDRVLHKTFHELNGKMVEVKRAIPKELSPGTSWSPLQVGHSFGFNRTTNFLNNYPLSSVGGYGVRTDGRYSPLASGRASFSPTFGMGVNMDQGLLNVTNYSSNLGFGRILNPYIGSSQAGRYSTPIGYNGSSNRVGTSSMMSSPRALWGNGGLTTSSNTSLFSSGNLGAIWGSSSSSGYGGGNVGFINGENCYPFGRNTTTSSFVPLNSDIYRVGSVYGDRTWQSTLSSELVGSDSFGAYGIGNSANAAAAAKDIEEYGVGYDFPNMQSSRGVAAKGTLNIHP